MKNHKGKLGTPTSKVGPSHTRGAIIASNRIRKREADRPKPLRAGVPLPKEPPANLVVSSGKSRRRRR